MKFFEMIQNNYFEIITEEKEDLNFFSFDLDDNVLTMPTKIVMLYNGNPKEISTEHFAEVRNEIGKGKWELPKNAFKNFRDEGNDQFLKDILIAKPGPSWNDFVECINEARIFSIITARGHSPDVIKQGIKLLIENNINGINKEECEKNIDKYRNMVGKPPKENKIDFYLNLCRFYPVSNDLVKSKLGGGGGEANPEILKTKAFDLFRKYVIRQGGKIKKIFKEKNIYMGFSDDDQKNIDKMKEHIKKTKPKFKEILKTSVKDTGTTPEKEVF